MLSRRDFLGGLTGGVALLPTPGLAQPTSGNLEGHWVCVLQSGFGTDEHIGATLDLAANRYYDWYSRYRSEYLGTVNLGNWSFEPDASILKLVGRGSFGRRFPNWRDEIGLWRALAKVEVESSGGNALALGFSEIDGRRFKHPVVLGFERT